MVVLCMTYLQTEVLHSYPCSLKPYYTSELPHLYVILKIADFPSRNWRSFRDNFQHFLSSILPNHLLFLLAKFIANRLSWNIWLETGAVTLWCAFPCFKVPTERKAPSRDISTNLQWLISIKLSFFSFCCHVMPS